jgi:hypothetical protein
MAEQMQDEVYVVEPLPGIDDELQVSLKDHKARMLERTGLAKDIGMPALARQDRIKVQSDHAVAWCKSRSLTPLSGTDRTAWEQWLPMPYFSSVEGISSEQLRLLSPNDKVRLLSEYQYYEGVPQHIRLLMKEVLPIFTRLEIRTPEKQPVRIQDPVLFGHIEFPGRPSVVYALARWGESDANLITLDEIKSILRLRNLRFDGGFAFAFGALGCILSLFLGLGLAIMGVLTTLDAFVWYLLLPSTFGTAVAWLVLSGYRMCKIFFFKKGNPHLIKMI